MLSSHTTHVTPREGADNTNTASPLTLPIDILLPIFCNLSVHDIPNIRQTSKNFLAVTRLRSLWFILLRIHVLERNLPVPGLGARSVESLSADELELYTHRALSLRKNWASSSPVAVRQIDVTPTPHPSRNISLHFLPGPSHRWLLSITAILTPQRSYLIQCWDVEASPPACMARRHVSALKSFVYNSDDNNSSFLAIQCPDIEIWAIDLTARNPDITFVRKVVLPVQADHLHAFSGSTLITRDDNERLVIWDVSLPDYQVELHNPELPEPQRPLSTIIHPNFAIVHRAQTMELFSLSSFRTGVASGTGPKVLHPITQHKFQWKIDSLCVADQPSWTPRQIHRLPNINVMVRYGSLFPWPVNMLHHYVLLANKSFIATDVVDINNLPYLISPTMIQSIASPVRLFASSHMAIGKYGTAVWTDSHTEDYFMDGNIGQRLAGLVLTAGDPEDIEVQGTDISAGLASTMASAVFSVRENDEWIGLSVDDNEGRIAMGCSNGEISLFEYA